MDSDNLERKERSLIKTRRPNRNMIKKAMLPLFILLSIVILSACGNEKAMTEVDEAQNDYETLPRVFATYEYLNLEETIEAHASNIVVAQFIGRAQTNEYVATYEFAVQENIFGEAEERIFVYHLLGMDVATQDETRTISFGGDYLGFETGVDYLLPLLRINDPYSEMDGGFMLLANMVLNLTNPTESEIYGEPLYYHSEYINENNLEGGGAATFLLGYIESIAEGMDEPEINPLTSNSSMDEILLNSPNVLAVEIGTAYALAQPGGLTDIYYVTVLESLYGGIPGGSQLIVSFFAGTVHPGEQVVVATVGICGDNIWHDFSSRNSLFSMDQLDEIRRVLSVDAEYIEAMEILSSY